MRTRLSSYPSPSDGITFFIRPKSPPLKRRKISPSSSSSSSSSDFPPSSSSSSSDSFVSPFDALHDEILITVMASLASSATCPADLVNAMLTCKRFCAAGAHPVVLSAASLPALAVTARRWSDGAHRFLRVCAVSGNADAAYTLGMIRFYCFNEREIGASLMAKAAMAPNAAALHSLAIIEFNGSGGTRKDKNLKNGASLCAKAAAMAHVDAMRELGHCLQDGYGVAKNVTEGRRLLLQANAREAAAAMASSPRVFMEMVQSTRGRCIIHGHERKRSVEAASKAEDDATIKMAEGPMASAAMKGQNQQQPPQPPLISRSPALHHHHHPHPVYSLLHANGCSLLSDFGCNVPPPKLHVANQFLVDWFAAKPPPPGMRLCSHGNCGRPETRRHEFRRCSACGKVNYCSRACQALDWKVRHKQECSPIADWEGRGEEEGRGANGHGT